MGSDPFPCIDFSVSDLKPGTPEWESTKSQVRKAAEEYGCFHALYKRIPRETQVGFLREMEALFDLPLEVKLRNIPDVPYSGYTGPYPGAPYVEGLGYHGSDSSLEEIIGKFPSVYWPDGRPSFSETVSSFSRKVVDLEKIIKRMLLESFGLDEKYYEELSNNADYLFKFIKYEVPSAEKKDIVDGLEAHRDRTSITILFENGVDGLEIKGESGEWTGVKFAADNLLVMIGESFRAWANNRLQSANHRVMMRVKETRYSYGLFSGFNADYTIKAPQELVDEEHPLKFNPYKFGDFVNFDLTEEQKLQERPELEVFCPV